MSDRAVVEGRLADVRRRLRGICDELGVRSGMEAVVLAVRHRVI